jgi:hypothetical protein
MTSAPSPRNPNPGGLPHPTEARCAAHRERVARSTCERCGNFVCEECGKSGPQCPSCRSRPGASEFAPCPGCQAQNAQRQGFTWWGGALGPKLFTHVKCGSCSTTYNGKTGRSNNTAIAVYFVVVNAVALGLLYAVYA